MQNLFNSVAVLALLGVVLLLFASAAMLKMIRDLQAGLVEAQAAGGPAQFRAPAVRTVADFAAPDAKPTYVMVVHSACPACRDRASELVGLAASYTGGHLAVLTADAACRDWFPGEHVRVVVDAVLLGRIAVGVTPSIVKYAPDGAEQWRRVVGSTEDLYDLLDIVPADAP
ncbi:hypothetical protein [Micromonospora sp. WMMD812]|uniref:hypothetical protein n=1 Tax=Micromonospora sp. WMMD812 TaxID=3015152 RepID=UPI00248C0638|nr:hypothetical protein [Micromonospora sp. WMMD812]WBB70078.1 hypothetical protein O7603_12235 [Micromonospora sp. WMMD812]